MGQGLGCWDVVSHSRRDPEKKEVTWSHKWEVSELAFDTRFEFLRPPFLSLGCHPSWWPIHVSEFHPLVVLAFIVSCSFPSHYLCLCGYLTTSAIPPVKQPIAVMIRALVLQLCTGHHLSLLLEICSQPPQSCWIRMCIFLKMLWWFLYTVESWAVWIRGHLGQAISMWVFSLSPLLQITSLSVKTWSSSFPVFPLKLNSAKMEWALRWLISVSYRTRIHWYYCSNEFSP